MDVIGTIYQASNIRGGANPPFTVLDFENMYPQFFEIAEDGSSAPLIPANSMDMYIELAHSIVKKSRYRGAWQMCMGLFIAHFITLYMQTMANPETGSFGVAQAGQTKGLTASKSVEGVSISYDHSQTLSDLNGWAAWKTTNYGVQFATFAKLYGLGGMYVP